MKTTSPPGRTAGRYLKSKILGKGIPDAERAYAMGQNWDDRTDVLRGIEFEVTKSAVSAFQLSDMPNSPVETDFWIAERATAITGKLPGVRSVRPRTRIISVGTGATASTVGEGSAAPMSALSMTASIVAPVKIIGLAAVTSDLIERAIPGGEADITADLAAAVATAEDIAFLNTSTGVLAGVTPLTSAGTSTGNIDTDAEALVQALIAANASLQSAVWIMGEATAARLANVRDASGARAFPGMGIAGTLLGLPVVSSKSAQGLLILLAQDGVAVAQGSVALSTSQSASLEMTTSPTANSITPTGSSAVSMFQSDSYALRAVAYTGFLARTGSVAYMTVSY